MRGGVKRVWGLGWGGELGIRVVDRLIDRSIDRSINQSTHSTMGGTHVAVVEGQGGVRGDELVLLLLAQGRHGFRQREEGDGRRSDEEEGGGVSV